MLAIIGTAIWSKYVAGSARAHIAANTMDHVKAVRELRLYGGLWVGMAPIAWFMALISTLKNDDDYWMQLGVFTVAAAAAVVFGVAAVFRQGWARLGLVILSWMGALIFGGPGLVIAGMGIVSQEWGIASIGLGTLVFALPFIALALRLHRLRLRPTVDAPSSSGASTAVS